MNLKDSWKISAIFYFDVGCFRKYASYQLEVAKNSSICHNRGKEEKERSYGYENNKKNIQFSISV